MPPHKKVRELRGNRFLWPNVSLSALAWLVLIAYLVSILCFNSGIKASRIVMERSGWTHCTDRIPAIRGGDDVQDKQPHSRQGFLTWYLIQHFPSPPPQRDSTVFGLRGSCPSKMPTWCGFCGISLVLK